jgi:ABC-2 type transport system ATP-binding protein
MSTVVELHELSRNFGKVSAVNELSLRIEEGEVFGILGPNGAGKSTTLSMMCGLTAPSSGRVSLFGKDLAANSLNALSRTGVMLERMSFYAHLSVTKNLAIVSRLRGREVTMDKTLDLVGLLHVAERSYGSLSQGMRQRVGLAAALLTEPELLILDEPTSGLDPEHTQELLQLLRMLSDEAGVSIVVSSHMMHEVETLCDRVAVLNQGRLVACEKTERLTTYDKSQLEVLTDSPDAIARKLREQAWVESAESRPGRVLVRLKEPQPNQLVHFLVNQGYVVSGVIPRRRTLQEYFLKALNP